MMMMTEMIQDLTLHESFASSIFFNPVPMFQVTFLQFIVKNF